MLLWLAVQPMLRGLFMARPKLIEKLQVTILTLTLTLTLPFLPSCIQSTDPIPNPR